jgi:hypothetical protein
MFFRWGMFRRTSQDDPQWDGTDAAHPAWWRGNDAGVHSTVAALNRVMNGEHTGTFGYAPLEQLANRLRDQRRMLGAALAEVERRK